LGWDRPFVGVPEPVTVCSWLACASLHDSSGRYTPDVPARRRSRLEPRTRMYHLRCSGRIARDPGTRRVRKSQLPWLDVEA
jgi:hypothetical protein